MTLSDGLHAHGHEQVLFSYDSTTGCRAIIAIHDTTLGPALGGCRFLDYKRESEALQDVLRLSRGMTYKSALAGLPLGGGKAVIMGDVTRLRNSSFFHSFGRFVNSFAGRYITSLDMNTCYEDLQWISEVSPYVAGLGVGSGKQGVSYATAWGVYCGLKAALQHRLSKENFSGLRVAVQGVGSVGAWLCGLLCDDGAELVVADIDEDRCKAMAESYGAKVVSPQSIHAQAVDVFVPCARGGGLNEKTIPEIQASIVGGAANNQLADESKHGKLLHERHILYAPDYVISGGGLMHAYYGLVDMKHEDIMEQVQKISSTLGDIFSLSQKQDALPHLVSYAMGVRRISEAKASSTPFSKVYEPQGA